MPEAFSQRFAEMRSANQAIALGSQSVFIILFLLVGGGVGTALLAKRRWIIWRPPLAWGALTAVLLGLGMANTLPLSWMEYDTAVSVGTFLAGQLGVAAAAAVIGTPLLAFVYLYEIKGGEKRQAAEEKAGMVQDFGDGEAVKLVLDRGDGGSKENGRSDGGEEKFQNAIPLSRPMASWYTRS